MRAFPHFDARWIIYDDGVILAIDKPPFIPSQAAVPEAPDDVVTRLRRFFSAQGERDPYIGVHQRLDKDTSGLMIFTRTPSANKAVASELEGRRAIKRYLAAVEGWSRSKATLVHHLARGKDGAMRVVPPSLGAKKAVTHVRLIERRGERSLIELLLETGRTHQARVQLAHEGCPIAGDALYRGPFAPRLMLHASGIDLLHPNGGKLTLRTKTPKEMLDWLERGNAPVWDDPDALAQRIDWARTKRYALAHGEGTNAFRVVNEEGDALSGVAVDLWDRWLTLQIHEGTLAGDAQRERLLDALAMLDADGIYLKVRPRGPVPADTTALAPRDPVRGIAAPNPLVVREEGMEIAVRLGEGLAPGLYLDQRRNRARVREASAGKRVLNLFCYTCAFTVAAVRGGARASVSVDASISALERGRENLLRAGADLSAHELVMDDAAAWLLRAARNKERFDLVILDPPSFGRAGRKHFSTASDYVDLARASMELLAPDGVLLACTNSRGMSQASLRKALFDAARAAKRTVAQMKDLAPAPDFPAAVGLESTMKSVWLRLDRNRV